MQELLHWLMGVSEHEELELEQELLDSPSESDEEEEDDPELFKSSVVGLAAVTSPIINH